MSGFNQHPRALPPSRAYGLQGGRFGTRGDFTLRPRPGGAFFSSADRENARGVLSIEADGPSHLSPQDEASAVSLVGFTLPYRSGDIQAFRSNSSGGIGNPAVVGLGINVLDRQQVFSRAPDSLDSAFLLPRFIEDVFCFGDEPSGNSPSGALAPRPTSRLANIQGSSPFAFVLWTPQGNLQYFGPDPTTISDSEPTEFSVIGGFHRITGELGNGGFAGLSYVLRVTTHPDSSRTSDFVVIDFSTGSVIRDAAQSNSDPTPIDHGPINSIRSLGRALTPAAAASHPESGTMYVGGTVRTAGQVPELLYAQGERAPMLICFNADGTERWRVTREVTSDRANVAVRLDVDSQGNCWLLGFDRALGIKFPDGSTFDGTRRAWRRRSSPGPPETSRAWVISPQGEVLMYFLDGDINHTQITHGDAGRMIGMIPGPRFFDWENPTP